MSRARLALVFLRAFAAGLLMVAIFAGCRPADPPAADSNTDGAGAAVASAATNLVERGRYLVTIAGCHDCHTPFKMGPQGPEPDMARMLSGHPESLAMPPAPDLGQGPWVWTGAGTNTAFAGPWGVSYANNLTPDQNTGIGAWTEEIFVKTLRSGRHWGAARPILPPMPWRNLAQMTDEDLKAIYAYLRSIPPIQNRAPASVPAPPPAAPASPTGP